MTKPKDPKDYLKVGAPEDYRAEFHIPEFLRLSKEGKNFKQIARDWGIARSTLYDWANRHPEFAYTMQLGNEIAEAKYIDLAQGGVMGGKVNVKTKDKKTGKEVTRKVKVDIGFLKLVTRNMFGWCEDSKLQVTGKDGGPIQVQTFTDLIKELEKDDN